MSQLATCLVEFLLFLGIPYLRSLQAFIALCITQLEAEEVAYLSQFAYTQAQQTEINFLIGIATAAADLITQHLNSLPIGAFQECTAVSSMIGTLRDPFAPVLDHYDEVLNAANRARAFNGSQLNNLTRINDDIIYLQNLNGQIDVIIAQIARGQIPTLP